jgi:hypothetical protein
MAIFTFLVQKGVLIRMVITKDKAPSVSQQAYLTIGNFKKSTSPPRRLFGLCLLLRWDGPRESVASCGVKYLRANEPASDWYV